jgi:RNA polymerase sigma-70 factor (ECF subfamily)
LEKELFDADLGDADEREQALGLLRERMVAFAASRMGRETAEDLVQEVLVVMEQKYRHVEAPEEMLPLGLKILRFKMMGFHRRRSRRGEHRQVAVEDEPLTNPAPDPEMLAVRNEARQRLREAMKKLDGRCRELFRLKLQGRSFAEIQGILKAGSLNTVYTWDFRCRQRLLELMGGKWEKKR